MNIWDRTELVKMGRRRPYDNWSRFLLWTRHESCSLFLQMARQIRRHGCVIDERI